MDTTRFDHSLEPEDVRYASGCNPHDLASAKRNRCLHLVDRPLKEGPVVTAIRGKCLAIAAGHVSILVLLPLPYTDTLQ